MHKNIGSLFRYLKCSNLIQSMYSSAELIADILQATYISEVANAISYNEIRTVKQCIKIVIIAIHVAIFYFFTI